MKRKTVFLNTLVLLMGSILFLLSACARHVPIGPNEEPLPYWTGEDGIYIDVRENLSAYGIRGKDYSNMIYRAPQFFVDSERKTEVVGNMGNNTWKLWVPAGTKDIYVLPPQIALITKMEEQQIPLDQVFPIQTDYFSVVGISIPKLAGKYPYEKRLLIEVCLSSESNQYPERLNLIYDGIRYRFSGISAHESEDKWSYIIFKCEMPDLNTAAMAMKYGSLQYSELQTIVLAEEAVYTCSDETINIHIIALEN